MSKVYPSRKTKRADEPDKLEGPKVGCKPDKTRKRTRSNAHALSPNEDSKSNKNA